MPDANESGMAPLRRDAVVASDLIAMRELLKAEAQAIHQLAQTAIQALDEKNVARFGALDDKVEALHRSQGERLDALNTALEEKLEALNKAGWDRIKDAEVASRERVEGLQEQLTVIERLAVERLEGVRREIILMQKNAEEAIEKATAATEKRFDSVNEFRGQLNDQTRTFATREMVEELRGRLEKAATREMVEQAASQRHRQIEAVEARIKMIEEWKSNSEGRQAVRTVLWPVLVGVVVFILTQVMRIAFPVAARIQP